MAEQSFPFENIDTTESQFSEWATNFQETGVQGSPTGTELTITVTGSDLNLTVAAGQAFIRGHYYINTDDLVLAVTSAGTNTRIDIVVVELDPETNTIVTKLVQGEAVSADPVAPTLTQSATGIYQLPIATLTIPTSTVALTAGMLVDTRTFMGNRVGIWTTATRPANPTAYQTLGYNTTIGRHESWNGTAWVGFFDPITTAGDLVIGDATGQASRLPIGTNETILKVIDGTLSWVDLVGSAFSLIVGSSGNTTFTFDTDQPAGAYSISSQLNDTTFDVYLVTSGNQNAGYTNSSALEATLAFNRVVVYGGAENDVLSFVTPAITPATKGDVADGAAPFLTSATPTTLASIDDTTTVTGGNFATDVGISFMGQDTVAVSAKSVVRSSSTELIVTRPDSFPEAQQPFTMTATNAGITNPSIGVNRLVDYFQSVPDLNVDYLLIAGGGAGSPGNGGGGGAGGYRAATGLTLTVSTNYTVTVGAGAATTSTGSNQQEASGADSVFSSFTSTGGGGSASFSNSNLAGKTGGSGGGGGGSDSGSANAGGSGNTPSTTPSQGNGGGNGSVNSTINAGGGGGGASASGQNATNPSTAGNGGAGTSSSITGTAVVRAGGGGGGSRGASAGTASGGGGAGGLSAQGAQGSVNTGGGGGGGIGSTGSNGGSGILILKYPDAYTATFSGGVTSSTATAGGYKVSTITATSTTSETVSFA